MEPSRANAPTRTRILETHPLNLPPKAIGDYFAKDATIVLKFFSTRTYAQIALVEPVLIGRDVPDTITHALDLNPFRGQEYGVSRQHCLLQRRDHTLTIADLNSTNGTFLNGERLIPGQEYPITSGDHLSLGRLFVAIYLSAPDYQ